MLLNPEGRADAASLLQKLQNTAFSQPSAEDYALLRQFAGVPPPTQGHHPAGPAFAETPPVGVATGNVPLTR